MNDNELLTQFFKLLDESGLPEDRRLFWVSKIRDGVFTEADHPVFTAELTEHLKNVDSALVASEFQLEETKNNYERTESSALPYLMTLSARQADQQSNEARAYKNEILVGEKEMSGKIEGIRVEKQTEDIVAIRRKLLS